MKYSVAHNYAIFFYLKSMFFVYFGQAFLHASTYNKVRKRR